MIIIKLEVENIRRLKAVAIEPTSPVVTISGRNEQGKTTLLDTIQLAIGGKKREQKFPLRHGEKSGHIIIDLGKYKITRTYTETGGGTLKVEGQNRETWPATQTLLDSFYADFTFDPLAFAKASPEKQLQMLLKVVPIQVDIEKVKAITGKSYVLENPLDCFRYAKEGLETERTEKGRERTRAQKAYESIVEGIPDCMEDTQPVELAALVQERDRLREQQLVKEEEQAKLVKLGKAVDEMNGVLRELSGQIDEAMAHVEGLKEERRDQNQLRMEVVEERGKQERAVLALKEPDFTEINEKIEKSSEVNRIAQQIEMRDEAKQKWELAKTGYALFTEALSNLAQYREECLRAAEFPIPGLSITDDGIICLDDVPISERGTSMKVMLGMHIVAAGNPTLKVILVREGNDLDSESIATITKWADEKGYQVWREAVADEADGACFFIEDGTVIEQPSIE